MGKSKDLATGETRFVNTAGDSMTGGLTVDAGNGNQLALDNDGERFTQVSFKNNGSQYAAVWYDNSINVLVNHAASGKGYVVQTGGSTDRLVIDSSGRVTTPYQPAFMSHKNGSHLETSGHNRVQSWTEFFDVGSHFDNSTGRFTAPIVGKYFFAFSAMHSGSVTGDLQFKIYKNGTEYIKANDTADGGGWDQCTVVCIMDMAVNDYAEPYQYSNATSSSIAVYDGKFSSWMGYLLG